MKGDLNLRLHENLWTTEGCILQGSSCLGDGFVTS